MSLDVSLRLDTPIIKKGTGVFVRENGQTKELTIEEVQAKFPNTVVNETAVESDYVFDSNITHNLTNMADAAGIYKA